MSKDIIEGFITNTSSINGTVSDSSNINGNITKSHELSGNIMVTILKGLSAYEVAVENGYTGTVEEWLQSLIGNGIESVDMDSSGFLTIYFTDNTSYTTPISLKGLSAYQIAVDNGYVGTVEQWLDSLGATVELGTVTSGGSVSITNSGTDKNAVFDFVLPTSIEDLSQNETLILYCGTATEVV